MNNVVKYDVDLDILLVGSIYVTTSCVWFVKENTKSLSSCNPRQPGLGTGMCVATASFLVDFKCFQSSCVCVCFEARPHLSPIHLTATLS